MSELKNPVRRGPPPQPAAQAGGGWSLVVMLGERAQRVMAGADSVDQTALNAMLRAHRAGSEASGFRVAALTMRELSADLTSLMQGVTALVAEASRSVASRERARRADDLFQAVDLQTGVDAAPIETLRRERTQEGQLRERQFVALLARLRLTLGQAMRRCDTGRSLARCALIEAVHGGALAPELRQVADDLSEAIGEMVQVLKSMVLELDEVHA